MKKKNIAGLIAIVAIVAVVIFSGCVEKEAPATTPTPSPTSTPTPPLNFDSGAVETMKVDVDV